MIKYLKQKKNFISILVFTLILILILVFFFYFLRKPEEPIEYLPVDDDSVSQPVLIPLEFLDENELIDLGLSPNIRAQVISRDPLIYKIIESDEDIIEDIAPFLEPIRE